MDLFRKGAFKGKTVFVAGGSTGINLGIAERFGEMGANVAVISRNEERIAVAAERVKATGADAIGLDWSVPLGFARDLQKEGPVQGNLDPMLMVAGGKALQDGIDAVLQALGQGPLIFNLGHGITPQADPENVTRLVQRVRGGAGA